MRARLCEESLFFKSVKSTQEQFQKVTRGLDLITVACAILGTLKSIKECRFHFILFAFPVLMVLAALSDKIAKYPPLLLIANLTDEEMDNLTSEKLTEACDYIRNEIIK